jgi:hypothetical protein
MLFRTKLGDTFSIAMFSGGYDNLFVTHSPKLLPGFLWRKRMQVSEQQIEQLVRALEETRASGDPQLPYEIERDESIDYYRGMINGLVLAHQMLIDCTGDEKRLARLMSLAAAFASEQYLNLRSTDEVLGSEEVTE